MGLFRVLSFSAAIFFFRTQSGHCADIIGGKESVPHSRPYMAALVNMSHHSDLFCRGTLIKKNWALTAAHCYPGREIEFRLKTRVFLGAHSWIKKESKQQRFKIVQVLSHPDYDKVTNKNDIMLLKLQGSAKIGRYVNTLELSSTTSSKDVKAGTQCLVAGWGDTYNGQEKPTKKLQEVNVTIIERRICNDKKHYNSRPYVTTDMVCAGDLKGGKDSCGGDSGGPLICNGEQRGIVSSGGPLCGDPRYPGIYTRLTKAYLTWIKRHTGDDTD